MRRRNGGGRGASALGLTASTPPASRTATAIMQDSDTGGTEYRITWRRATWRPSTKSKTRTFGRRDAAERYLAKLRGAGRPDLSRAQVWLSHRPVGAWRDGWPA